MKANDYDYHYDYVPRGSFVSVCVFECLCRKQLDRTWRTEMRWAQKQQTGCVSNVEGKRAHDMSGNKAHS